MASQEAENEIGFTGTAKGMTAQQLHTLTRQLQAYDTTEAHHGDSVGADTELHGLVRQLFFKSWNHWHDRSLEAKPY